MYNIYLHLYLYPYLSISTYIYMGAPMVGANKAFEAVRAYT